VTAFPTETRGRRARLGAALLASAIACASLACASHAPPIGNDILLPLALPQRWLPEPSDQAATDLAVAALIDDREGIERSMRAVESADDSHVNEDLVPLCTDLVNATSNDRRVYRQSSKRLTQGWGTDPALEARLDLAVSDDPLKLAWKRRRDTWETLWARTFNAFSEPIGRTVISGFTMAPYTIAMSTAHYLASFSNDEPLSLTDRQALVLRKEYVARYPDSPEAPALRKKIAHAEKKLAKTMRRRRLREAKAAESHGSHRAAMIAAQRTLFWGPDETAEEIKTDAEAALVWNRALQALSLKAGPAAPRDLEEKASHDLAVELLVTSSTAAPLRQSTFDMLLRDSRRKDARGDEALYVLSTAQLEAGYEDASWESLNRLAGRDTEESTMSRHARHTIADPWQNPYNAYKDMRARKRNEEIRWRILGEWTKQNRYPNLPKPISLALDVPSIAQTIILSPVRLIFGRWQKGPDFHRPSAVLGYRYLGRFPEGAHKRTVMEWLIPYEESRGNYVAALRLADFMPDFDDVKRTELAEEASSQALAAATRTRRPDRRTQILRQAVLEYPDTESGMLAGKRVREEYEHASAQKIRMTRSFLIENPRVSGEQGLGINPILINGEVSDGELHPIGVTFLGARRLRFDMVPESGKEDDTPKPAFRTISSERLARLASMLDETTRRNQLIDGDDELGVDPDRDQFLERARLGLAETPDKRPTAQSTYVYESMRERYGMVRGRESILPFDIVVQGDFTGLNLGAFPRWRKPKETPDAYLYR
jgi:hypothetical protein